MAQNTNDIKRTLIIQSSSGFPGLEWFLMDGDHECDSGALGPDAPTFEHAGWALAALADELYESVQAWHRIVITDSLSALRQLIAGVEVEYNDQDVTITVPA
jgi:hypothetical protein